MRAADRNSACEQLQELVVDYADGTLDAESAAVVEGHCAACEICSQSLAALREIPSLLRGGAEPPAVSWEAQRARIMAVIDGIAEADAARTRGFDVRLLLPLAAAVVIAFAGVISLRSGGVDGSGAQPARAALRLAMEDPLMTAEISDLLGEPLVFSAPLWSEQEVVVSGDPWIDPGAARTAPTLEELSDEELLEVERMLGA